MYLIQHYLIKFVSALWQVSGFLQVFSTNKIDGQVISEILLKVLLNTITLTSVIGSSLSSNTIHCCHDIAKYY